MVEPFIIVVNLSHCNVVPGHEKIFTTLVDPTKTTIVYEFKVWIQWMFSLEHCVTFKHKNSVVHDLEDIQILAKLKSVDVIPCPPVCIHIHQDNMKLFSGFDLFGNWNNLKIPKIFLGKLSSIMKRNQQPIEQHLVPTVSSSAACQHQGLQLQLPEDSSITSRAHVIKDHNTTVLQDVVVKNQIDPVDEEIQRNFVDLPCGQNNSDHKPEAMPYSLMECETWLNPEENTHTNIPKSVPCQSKSTASSSRSLASGNNVIVLQNETKQSNNSTTNDLILPNSSIANCSVAGTVPKKSYMSSCRQTFGIGSLLNSLRAEANQSVSVDSDMSVSQNESVNNSFFTPQADVSPKKRKRIRKHKSKKLRKAVVTDAVAKEAESASVTTYSSPIPDSKVHFKPKQHIRFSNNFNNEEASDENEFEENQEEPIFPAGQSCYQCSKAVGENERNVEPQESDRIYETSSAKEWNAMNEVENFFQRKEDELKRAVVSPLETENNIEASPCSDIGNTAKKEVLLNELLSLKKIYSAPVVFHRS